ncbi:NHL domain-containing protein [Candidatus Nitrospira bockiana]
MGTSVELAIGYIETFAGNGKARSTGDGKPAVKAGIPLPHHVALDKEQRYLYIAESGSDRVRRIDLKEGTIHNFAGIGETCYSGDGGPCSEAGLYLPLDLAFDSQNNLYICDSGSNRIRRVDHETGTITTVVGSGQHGYNGDGPALEINLTWPAAIAFDADDVLYIADTQAHRVRRYDPQTGLVTTIAGTWSEEDDAREQPLVARNLVVLSGDAIGIDFSDDNGWLMPVCSDGLDLSLYLDDGRPAREARLYDLVGIAVDSRGHVYVVDKGSNRVRKIDKDTGVISTLAGVCRYGWDGDGKAAVRSMLHAPEAVIFDAQDNAYVSDTMNHRVRRVEAGTGIITTIAGNGDSGYEDKHMGGCGAARFVAKEAAGQLKHGDGLLATDAVVNSPVGLALDAQGFLYICERGENKIRRTKLW